MTPEQEKRGAELFAAGATEREVAEELGVGAGSANRLHKKLRQQEAEAEAAPETTEPEQHDEAVLQAADEVITDEAMALLEADRDRLAGQLLAFQERAQASWSGKQTLEQERDQLLLDTGDASGVDQRLEDADRNLRKWVRGAELITPQLAEVNARIGRLSGYRELADLRAGLDAAVAERDEVHSRSGDRQRAAVAAVRAAAEDFCAVAADERVVTGKVAALASAVTQRAMQLGEAMPGIPEPPKTGLTVRGDVRGPELALVRALTQALAGDVAAVARHLAEVNGQLPTEPSAEEIERFRQMTADRERQLVEQKSAPGPGGSQAHTADLDHTGREIWPRPPHPLDVYGQGYANTTGGSYGTGYRTGW